MNRRAAPTILFCNIILAVATTHAMDDSPFTEYFSGNERYIHLTARGCSLHVGSTDTSHIILTRRGETAVSTVSSSTDSLRVICSGMKGSVHLLVPSPMIRSDLFIEYEDSHIGLEDMTTNRINLSGINGSVRMEACTVESLIAVVDQSTVRLDTRAVMILLNTIDSSVILRGRSENLTIMGEGGTLIAETTTDTVMYDLNNVRSEIGFMNHSVRSGLIIGYRGEMSIAVPAVSMNSLLLRIRDGDYSVDSSLSVTTRSRENGYVEISTTTGQKTPRIRIILDGSSVKLGGSP